MFAIAFCLCLMLIWNWKDSKKLVNSICQVVLCLRSTIVCSVAFMLDMFSWFCIDNFANLTQQLGRGFLTLFVINSFAGYSFLILEVLALLKVIGRGLRSSPERNRDSFSSEIVSWHAELHTELTLIIREMIAMVLRVVSFIASLIERPCWTWSAGSLVFRWKGI